MLRSRRREDHWRRLGVGEGRLEVVAGLSRMLCFRLVLLNTFPPPFFLCWQAEAWCLVLKCASV